MLLSSLRSSLVFVPSLLAFIALTLTGCATYTTPGGPANLSAIAGVASRDTGTAKGAQLGNTPAAAKLPPGHIAFDGSQPTANFPANVVAARIQSAGYDSNAVYRPRGSNFSVITARDVEDDATWAALVALPGLDQLAPLNRLLLPEELDDARDLREAAAKVRADMLLLYTFDTVFRQEDQDVGPLNTLALGLLPNQKLSVNTTASAVLIDTQSGYIYGFAEATADAGENTNIWRGRDGLEALRFDTEAEAFEKLVDELVRLWSSVYGQQGGGRALGG